MKSPDIILRALRKRQARAAFIAAAALVLGYGAAAFPWSMVFERAGEAAGAGEGEPGYITVTPEAAPIGDRPRIRDGLYLRISRRTEYYSWAEKRARGGEYVYSLEWTAVPAPVSGFNRPAWHAFRKAHGIADTVKNPQPKNDEKPEESMPPFVRAERFIINAGDITLYGDPHSEKIFPVRGDPACPVHGDARAVYRLYRSDVLYTFAGCVKGDTMVPCARGKDRLLAAAPGHPEDLAEAMRRDERSAGPWWFALGFLLMAAGLLPDERLFLTLKRRVRMLRMRDPWAAYMAILVLAFTGSAIVWFGIRHLCISIPMAVLAALIILHRKRPGIYGKFLSLVRKRA
jgi:hypothetical protein